MARESKEERNERYDKIARSKINPNTGDCFSSHKEYQKYIQLKVNRDNFAKSKINLDTGEYFTSHVEYTEYQRNQSSKQKKIFLLNNSICIGDLDGFEELDLSTQEDYGRLGIDLASKIIGIPSSVIHSNINERRE